MPVITSKLAQLPEDIGMHIDALRKRYPAIGDVWFFGPEDTPNGLPGTPLMLLAFADPAVLDAIRAEREWHRDDVHLLVAVDGDRFEEAWGVTERGRLSDVDWRVEDVHTASYRDTREGSQPGRRYTATRVR